MTQPANKSVGGLLDGEFIDLTDEVEPGIFLNEDDILILDTNNEPMEDLTAAINNQLKSVNNQPKNPVSETGPRLATKGSTKVVTMQINDGTNKAEKPTAINKTLLLNVNSPIRSSDLAQKQLNESVAKQVLKSTNSKNVYLLNKTFRSGNFQRAELVKTGDAPAAIIPLKQTNDSSQQKKFFGVNDIVLTPSSSEIRNKKFPKDSLSESTTNNEDDDVIFVRNRGKKKLNKPATKSTNSALQKKTSLGSKISPKTTSNYSVTTARNRHSVSPISNEILIDVLEEVRIKPASAAESELRDKKETLTGEKGSNRAQNPSVQHESAEANTVVLNGLSPETIQNCQSKLRGILRQNCPVSKGVIKEVHFACTTPKEKVTGQKLPPKPQKIILSTDLERQSHNSSQNSDDDDIICLTEDPQPKAPNSVMGPYSNVLIGSEPQTAKMATKDIEDRINLNIILKDPADIVIPRGVNKLLAEDNKAVKSLPLNGESRVKPTSRESYSLADIAETASAVANIPNGTGEELVGQSKKGNPLIFLLCPLDEKSGAKTNQNGQINKVLALVPSDSPLAPPKIVPSTSKEKEEELEAIVLSDSETVEEEEPEFISRHDSVSNSKVPPDPSSTKDIEIEPAAAVTPVDIMKILNQGKKKSIPGRCENNEELSSVYLRGFRKTRKSSCIVELKTIIKREENNISSLKKLLKRYDSNFVACGSSTNYFLSETVKTELEEPEETGFELDGTETLPTIHQVISKVSEEFLQMQQSQTKSPHSISKHSKTEEALKLIKQGLEMIHSWSRAESDAVFNKATVEKPKAKPAVENVSETYSSVPVIQKPRGRRKQALTCNEDVILIENRVKPLPARRGRGKNDFGRGGVGISGAKRKLNVEETNKWQKNLDTTDSGDDLLVVKRVDIIKSNGNVSRGRKRKQQFS